MTLWTTSKRGWSIKWGGATQAQQGMNFKITLIFISLLHENRTLLKMWEPVRFSNWMPGENLQSGSHDGCHLRFSIRTVLKTGASFQPMGENRPTLIFTPKKNPLYLFTSSCFFFFFFPSSGCKNSPKKNHCRQPVFIFPQFSR
jgi:hypothetical protein